MARRFRATIASASKDQLRHAQMIYQMADTAVNPRQRIREIIGRPLSFYLGMKAEQLENRIRELLDRSSSSSPISSSTVSPPSSRADRSSASVSRVHWLRSRSSSSVTR